MAARPETPPDLLVVFQERCGAK